MVGAPWVVEVGSSLVVGVVEGASLEEEVVEGTLAEGEVVEGGSFEEVDSSEEVEEVEVVEEVVGVELVLSEVEDSVAALDEDSVRSLSRSEAPAL